MAFTPVNVPSLGLGLTASFLTLIVANFYPSVVSVSSATFSGPFKFSLTSPVPVFVAVLSGLNVSVAFLCPGFSVGTKTASFVCFSYGLRTVWNPSFRTVLCFFSTLGYCSCFFSVLRFGSGSYSFSYLEVG